MGGMGRENKKPKTKNQKSKTQIKNKKLRRGRGSLARLPQGQEERFGWGEQRFGSCRKIVSREKGAVWVGVMRVMG